MPTNQTFELPGLEAGHIVIAINPTIEATPPTHEGFNQACQDMQPLWRALSDRLSGNHFLSLAAMFAEYVRAAEIIVSQEDLNNAPNQSPRNIIGAIRREFRRAAADRGYSRDSDDAENSVTGCDDVVPSFG